MDTGCGRAAPPFISFIQAEGIVSPNMEVCLGPVWEVSNV